VEEGETRELDYETDILAAIDWRGFEPKDIATRIPENAQAAESQLQRISLTEDGEDFFVGEVVAANPERLAFDAAHAVRLVSDIVPNPFVGREIVGKLLSGLRKRGFDETRLGQLSGLIVDTLRAGLDAERSKRAEALFKAGVVAGRIQFRLRLDGRNWQMPFEIETMQPEGATQLPSRDGSTLTKSLFSPVYSDDMNGAEREVAVYLDGEKALAWWHRNVAKNQYGLQGWKKARVYPDFIFAAHDQGKSKRIAVIETKGDQLDNLDTAYKRELLSFLSQHFKWDDAVPAGELELVKNSGESVHCELVLMSEWPTKLPGYFA
jgi:type III restriction enzyme